MERIVKVVKVLRDDRNRAIWVQIQYIKNDDLLHDAVFVRGRDDSIYLLEKRIDNFIPPKRFKMMCNKAAAVIFDKRAQESKQEDLPLG